MKKLSILASTYLIDEIVSQTRDRYGIGVTITEVKDFFMLFAENNKDHFSAKQNAYTVDFLPNVCIEIVIPNDLADYLISDIKGIVESSWKAKAIITIEDIPMTLRIRTGEIE